MKTLALNSLGEEVALTSSELVACKQALEIEREEFTTLFFQGLSSSKKIYVVVSKNDDISRSYLMQLLRKRFGENINNEKYN
ncbi:TPA: hypothetical protein U1C36_001730 [Streptococcus suis]|nr:hypothetical protein [Streptococcus suis]HEM3648973.1 hypothetical protein [Streptococcus suis]